MKSHRGHSTEGSGEPSYHNIKWNQGLVNVLGCRRKYTGKLALRALLARMKESLSEGSKSSRWRRWCNDPRGPMLIWGLPRSPSHLLVLQGACSSYPTWHPKKLRHREVKSHARAHSIGVLIHATGKASYLICRAGAKHACSQIIKKFKPF